MADTQFLRLSDKWALAYDPLQEKDIVPDLGKMEEVLALPYKFKEWY